MITNFYAESYPDTVGPWGVVEGEGASGLELSVGDGLTTITVITGAHGRHNEEMNRRNAKLIASAPTMLKALLHYRRTGSDELFAAAIAAAIEGGIEFPRE